MMPYTIQGEDVPDSLEKRTAARPAHLERIKALQDEGRLILAGPHPAIDSPDPAPQDFPEVLSWPNSNPWKRRKLGPTPIPMRPRVYSRKLP